MYSLYKIKTIIFYIIIKHEKCAKEKIALSKFEKDGLFAILLLERNYGF